MDYQTTPSPPPHNQRLKGCLMGCLAVIGIGSVAVILVVLVFSAAIGRMGGKIMEAVDAAERNPGGEHAGLAEVWVSGEGMARVARVHINGVILLNNERLGLGNGSPDLALASIRRATLDPGVRGLILELNSPGGGITASDILYNAVLDFKKADPGRRVLALMNDLAASGAYYVACAADEIIAHPTTLTGSIGVIIQSYNVSRLAETLGVTDVTVKSGENKDLLNPFRPVDGERVAALVQPLVDDMFARFTGVVCAGRGLDGDAVRALADGRLFTAQSALDNGLVDALGYRAESEARMGELLGASISVFRYEESFSFSSLFRHSFMRMGGGAGVGAALREMVETPETRFMYLWRP